MLLLMILRWKQKKSKRKKTWSSTIIQFLCEILFDANRRVENPVLMRKKFMYANETRRTIGCINFWRSIFKVHIFWEDHKNFKTIPSLIMKDQVFSFYLFCFHFSKDKLLDYLPFYNHLSQCDKRSCSKPKSVQRLGTVFSLFFSWSENWHYFLSRLSISKMLKWNLCFLGLIISKGTCVYMRYKIMEINVKRNDTKWKQF